MKKKLVVWLPRVAVLLGLLMLYGLSKAFYMIIPANLIALGSMLSLMSVVPWVLAQRKTLSSETRNFYLGLRNALRLLSVLIAGTGTAMAVF